MNRSGVRFPQVAPYFRECPCLHTDTPHFPGILRTLVGRDRPLRALAAQREFVGRPQRDEHAKCQ